MACCRSGPDLHPMYFFAQWIWGPAETVSQGSLEYVTSFYCMDKDLGKGSGKGIGKGSPAQPEPKPELPLEPEAGEEVVLAAVDAAVSVDSAECCTTLGKYKLNLLIHARLSAKHTSCSCAARPSNSGNA